MVEDLGRRPVEQDPAAVDRDDPAAEPVEQVGLVLRDQQRRPRRRERRSASPTSRVPAGSSWAVGSSRITWRGRIASNEAIADELGLAAGQARRVAPGERLESQQRRSPPRARDGLGDRRPRFIGPSATSSKTVAAIPDRCVFGFWKPTTTRSRARASAGRSSARRRSRSVPSASRRSRPGRGPRRRGRASTCRPRSARPGRRSRRRRAAGRCPGGRLWRSPA